MEGFNRRIALASGAALLLSGGALGVSLANGAIRLDPALTQTPGKLLVVGLIPIALAPGLALVLWFLPVWSRGARQLKDRIQRLTETREQPASNIRCPDLAACASALTAAAERIQSERVALEDNAFRDALTELPNRRPFMDSLMREASSSLRMGRPLSLVMADLDHFKALNDRYGHQIGDRVLRHVAGRFSSLVRHSDMVSRFGGEEFAILLPGATLATALEITHQLRNALHSDPIDLGCGQVSISCSFGVAEMLQCRLSGPDELLHEADMALYEAKRQGRDRVLAAASIAAVPASESRPVDPTQECRGATTTGDRTASADSPPIRAGDAPLDHDTLALMGCTFSMLQVMPDKHRVVRDMVQQVASVLQCGRVSVLLVDADRRRLIPVAAAGLPGPTQALEIPIETDLKTWLRDLTGGGNKNGGDILGPMLIDGACPHEGQAVVYVPVVEYEEVLGVIVATELPAGTQLTARQGKILEAIGAIGASALRSCDEFARLERDWMGSIEGLCAAITAGFSGRRDHGVRVRSRCLETARELGRHDGPFLQGLQIAACLYDVGKMDVPRSLLDKKGRLRAEEVNLIRDHCRRGAAIVGTLPGLEAVSRMVLHHHEHFDGTGYPDGLAGAAIPLESRIIAVVDAYEAMISDRAYRRAVAPQAAMDALRASSGSQFDPEVVAAFLRTRSLQEGPYGPIAAGASPAGRTAAA